MCLCPYHGISKKMEQDHVDQLSDTEEQRNDQLQRQMARFPSTMVQKRDKGFADHVSFAPFFIVMVYLLAMWQIQVLFDAGLGHFRGF